MQKYREAVAELCKKSFEQSFPEQVQIFTDLSNQICSLIEAPRESAHGDLALPCFIFAKALKSSPAQIAGILEKNIQTLLTQSSCVASAAALGPYLNFRMNSAHVAKDLSLSLSNKSLFAPLAANGEKIMIEYSQPNTHKAFHVGHVRCAALGDTINRLYRWVGYETHPVNYLGDEGTHVAKCLWYLSERYQGEVPDVNRGEFLGVLYSLANNELSLETYSDCPIRGVSAAKILSHSIHPQEKKWNVVELETATGKCTVVTAATIPQNTNYVAYAKPGIRLSGRAPIGVVEKKGVVSTGMLCTAYELDLGEEKELLLTLPDETVVGTELAEIYAKPEYKNLSVLQHVEQLETAVSSYLQRLEAGDETIKKLWEETKQWSMDEYYNVYAWLRCEFEHYFFESEFGELGKELVREFLEKGIFVHSDGTVGADLKADGLGFCILIKSDGTATYACRDLALARKKFEQYQIDRSYYVVDSAQRLHFQQVFRCLEMMGYPQAALSEHIAYEQVVRPDGKMGSRKGNVILFTQLKELLYSKLENEFLSKYRGEWPDEEVDAALHALSLATMRYGMLSQENNSQIVFDLDEWTSRSGNTGPYLMYAYARTRSIIRDLASELSSERDFSLLTHESEHALLMHIAAFEDTVLKAAKNFSPNILCAYLFELSKAFNRFYANCPVKAAETQQLRATRLALVELTGSAINAGFELIGVPVIERM